MDRRHQMLRLAPMVVGTALVVLLLAGTVWAIHHFVATKPATPPRVVQIVQVIRPPPPPAEEPPPPPETHREEVQEPEPEPAPNDAPTPSEQLGLDAEGTAGGDSFGLMARKGGQEITGSGGAQFAWYTGMLKGEVLDRLTGDARLRSKRFTVTVRLWITPDGTLREVHLASSSGNRDVDHAIEAALASIGRLKEAPPLEMPQPVSLRVVSRS